MNTTTAVVAIALSTLAALSSTTTLVIVLVGGRKAMQEVDNVKTKTNTAVDNMKSALDNLKI